MTAINEDGSIRRQNFLWVEAIVNPIANKSNNTHINIRIFLVTVVDNCSKWFQNYANVVTPAIVKFLIDWTTMNRSIDALTVFCLVDILEWESAHRIITKDSPEEEQDLASELMANLMTYAHNSQREVFRRNLELIRNLMERWRDFIKLPYQLLYEKISDPSVESKSNALGLHLNGIVLANGLIPWTEELKIPFLHAIRTCLENYHTDVYQPAAQVLGMVLHETIVKQKDESMDQFVAEFVQHLKQWQRSNEKKFMYTIFYIDKYYVIKEFITVISSLIATSPSDMKKFYLQMFLARVNYVESRDVEVVLLDLLSKSHEHQHQLIGLHIFNKALPKMSVAQIKHILPRVVSFQDAKQTEIRDVVYEIMKYIRENHFHGADDELNRQSTDILLKGLNDVDKDLQNSVFKYWNELPELPAMLNNRILFMFQHLYSFDFLKYGVPLLIDLKSNDLKNVILNTRVDDANQKHTEYDINVNWKSQDNSLRVPLFTESQQKNIINSEIDATQSYLRATQHTLQFDPTLDPSSLHQSTNSFSLQSQSSLFVDGSTQMLDRRSQQVQQSQAQTVTQTKFSYLRERILRNKEAISREWALNAVRRRDYRQRQENQQQKRKEGQVTLYRRYRFGDFPDFLINSLAFLLPLQVLVKLDPILARNTFVAILNAVYEYLEEDDKRTFLNGLAQTIATIIKQPNNCDPMLFSALTEIILTNMAEVQIESGISMAIPNANDMMINAILLLENQINTTCDESNSEAWAELAHMYYSLSEYDVSASIFAHKMNTDKLLSVAIESESNGDYSRALESYTELINKHSDPEYELFNKHAIDFAYQSLYNCFEVMGRWEDLEDHVLRQLSDEDDSQQIQYEQLWADEWNSKYLLPHYICSEVQSMIYNNVSEAAGSFIANIEQWLRNPTRADVLKKHFGEQLTILHVANKDYLNAKVFSNQYFESFLDQWSAMTILSEKMRNNKLMNIRRVAEMHKYADLLKSSTIDDSIIAELTDRWYRTKMNSADSTKMWESLVSYRILVTDQAMEKFDEKTAPIVDRLIESMFEMQFKLYEIAGQQQNYDLSGIVLQRLNSFRNVYGRKSERNRVQFELATVKQEQNKWMTKPKDPKVAFNNLVKIWTNLAGIQNGRRNALDTNPDLRLKTLDQLNVIADQAIKIVSKYGTTIDDTTKQKVAELTGTWDSCKYLQFSLFRYSFE